MAAVFRAIFVVVAAASAACLWRAGKRMSQRFRNFRREPHFQAQTCTRRGELLVRGMQSILTKSMKDSVVRGCLLQLLYERRSEGSIPFGQGEHAVPPPGGIRRRDWLRAVVQLSEHPLIEWTPSADKSATGQ